MENNACEVKPKRNPLQQKGFRNVFCLYYGNCLDDVIRQGWNDWDCRDCLYQDDKGAAPEVQWYVKHSVAYYEVKM